MTAELEVPKAVMSNKHFTCPVCNATVSCYVDIFAGHFEVIPREMERHIRWHEANNHIWLEEIEA